MILVEKGVFLSSTIHWIGLLFELGYELDIRFGWECVCVCVCVWGGGGGGGGGGGILLIKGK